MGEVVRLEKHSEKRAWWLVRNATDGYRGWSRAWGLVPCSRVRAVRWQRRATGAVVVPRAEVRSRPGGGVLVSPVFWQGRFIVGPARGRYRPAELPDGRRGWVRASEVSLGKIRPLPLESRIAELLGIPYLWGGRTPMGVDCSALVQLVFAEHGIRLPRDARDQWGYTQPILNGAPARRGDLLFFGATGDEPSHVGLSLGEGYFLHARGRVLIGSLDKANQLCDKALARQYKGARALPRQVLARAPIRVTRS
jgi:hypothetical protein